MGGPYKNRPTAKTVYTVLYSTVQFVATDFGLGILPAISGYLDQGKICQIRRAKVRTAMSYSKAPSTVMTMPDRRGILSLGGNRAQGNTLAHLFSALSSSSFILPLPSWSLAPESDASLLLPLSDPEPLFRLRRRWHTSRGRKTNSGSRVNDEKMSSGTERKVREGDKRVSRVDEWCRIGRFQL